MSVYKKSKIIEASVFFFVTAITKEHNEMRIVANQEQEILTNEVVVFNGYVGYTFIFKDRLGFKLFIFQNQGHESLSARQRHITTIVSPDKDLALCAQKFLSLG